MISGAGAGAGGGEGGGEGGGGEGGLEGGRGMDAGEGRSPSTGGPSGLTVDISFCRQKITSLEVKI